MACEIQTVGLVVAFGNAAVATPSGAVIVAVAPPLEPLAALKMWLSWTSVLIAMGFLITCLDQNGRSEDAASLKQEQERLRREMDDIKSRIQ